MSDPVSNAEIEDVLSSIRRLVSDDVRGAKDEDSEPESNAEAGRLVLTPSFRVAEDDGDDAAGDFDEALSDEAWAHDDAEDAETDIAVDAFVLRNPELPEESADAEFGDDEDAAPDAIDPEAPWQDPDATLYEAAAQLDTSDEGMEDSWAEDAQDRWAGAGDAEETTEASVQADAASEDPEPTHTETEATAVLPEGAEPAADGDVVAAEDVEPDDQGGSDTNPTDMTAAVSDPTVAEGEDDDGADVSGDVQAANDLDDPQPQQASVSAVQALHAVIAETESQSVADLADEAENQSLPTGEPIQWQDAEVSEGEEDQSLQPQTFAKSSDSGVDLDADADADDEDDGTNLLAEDEAVLDEAMLRELVRDIVREELQGALGERITRNVRKLVRREINRAISLQDLE